ncbi:MAG: tetratricopeptide repeat protein [Polyangia bacterium]
MIRALVVAFLLCSLPARADSYADAKRQYANLEYDQALASLADAKRQAPTPTRLAEVLRIEGCVYAALDRPDDALADFRKALRADASLASAPDRSPKIARVWADARRLESERLARRAALLVELGPVPPPIVASRGVDVAVRVLHAYPEAQLHLVVVDGSALETSLPVTPRTDGTWRAHVPADLLPPSATLHLYVRATDEGEETTRTATRTLAAPRTASALTIITQTVPTSLTVDGVEVSEMPVLLAPGPHEVSLESRRGHVTQRVVLTAGEVASVTLRIEPTSLWPIARYTALALGGALLVTGGVLYDQSDRAYDRYRGAVVYDPYTHLPTTSYTQARSFETSGNAFRVASIVTLALGAAFTATGLGLFALHPLRHGVTTEK